MTTTTHKFEFTVAQRVSVCPEIYARRLLTVSATGVCLSEEYTVTRSSLAPASFVAMNTCYTRNSFTAAKWQVDGNGQKTVTIRLDGEWVELGTPVDRSFEELVEVLLRLVP